MTELPAHLKRYVVSQDYSRYTPLDHSVWRYLLRQLRSFLGANAHTSYLDGLKKTGISIDRIPKISEISERLEEFGWRAVPVSGFIPPAAFMELQSLSYLPIASDMRTLEHMMYTPAPDIVHEAAGHAPILAEPRFADYLREYAQVSRNAIISREDMDQYEAIRELSDLKEHPETTQEQLEEAGKRLNRITESMSHLSEAALLGRMNWWTAEYGLIGNLEKPKIFGAGLLSSVGEARNCLSPEVKKLPLSIDCINYGYDITEQQPQLFVAEDFQHLSDVLEELASTMAFRTGGKSALEKARQSRTVNTVELDSGLQISGQLAKWTPVEIGAQEEQHRVAYLQFEGPAQLAVNGKELPGHGVQTHAQGFGTPIGFIKGSPGNPLAQWSDSQLESAGIQKEKDVRLEFESGVVVSGRLESWLRTKSGVLLLLSFSNCTVTLGSQVLFQPAWGTFDMAVGSKVAAIFGGPADRDTFGSTDDFETKRVPEKIYSKEKLRLFNLLQKLRETREGNTTEAERTQIIGEVLSKLDAYFPNEWLPRLEALEMAEQMAIKPPWRDRVRTDLETMAAYDSHMRSAIDDGLKLLRVP